MRHDPTIKLDRHGQFATIASCSCGWTPAPDDTADTDDLFAWHIASVITQGSGEHPQPLSKRLERFARWSTARLIDAVIYRDKYGEAAYMGGPAAKAETISGVLHILTGLTEDIDRATQVNIINFEGVLVLPLEYDDRTPPRDQIRVVVKGVRGTPRVWVCPTSGCAILDDRCAHHPTADCIEIGRSEEL